MDFFTVPTLTGGVLFVLVMLSHYRRRIVHLAITWELQGQYSVIQLFWPRGTRRCDPGPTI
jgi:hypothetical protein